MTASTGALALRPDVVWPATITAEQARAKVARRLPERVDLDARLYHHPFLGLVFVCRAAAPRLSLRAGRPAPSPMLAHVVIDLVGGQAYLGDPWDDSSFVREEEVPERSGITGPRPVLDQEAAIQAGRAVLAGVLLRRRRLGTFDRAELHAPPVLFGKPNWWVTGQRGDRRIEVIVDGLSGRHYACSA